MMITKSKCTQIYVSNPVLGYIVCFILYFTSSYKILKLFLELREEILCDNYCSLTLDHWSNNKSVSFTSGDLKVPIHRRAEVLAVQFDPLNLALPTRSHHKGSYYTKRMSMYSNRLQPALQNLLQHVVWFFHPRASCTTMHISADVQRITLNMSCMTISGGKTKQLDIFCRVTGFTSDFLSFIVVELIWFFHGAIQLFW